MDTNVYIIIVGVLFALAISDLIVGVSNDAVNFLNSAIGSNAAPFRVIMIIAALGILIGATFSSGMMEVARKGIFNPQKFYFDEIMIIFLAVMMTDIILLDTYNTFGLPTSTTVSIVFELLGAAVAVSVIKITAATTDIGNVGDFINSSRALLIISGILLSVIIAFTVGAAVQYLTRFIFSFNFERTYKYFGAIWGGIAITAITYFILIKGAKGSSFLSNEDITWIMTHSTQIIFIGFVGWTVILQLSMWLFKLNILKFIVLVGTFALAMAFAGNDLVNFIGVPLAGFESFKAFASSGTIDPGAFSMEILQGKVKTPTEFLLIAGVVMVVTLWLSKKARSVTKTTLDLCRQDEGEERFGSSVFARTVVRESLQFGKFLERMLPASFFRVLNSRFDQTANKKKKKNQEETSFDLLRASVNLVVAAILISIGTANKLPLSTTYVTFMVAMGTSLADGAWDRESAVYRITGVVTVIGGWFFTAFLAFTAAFIIAYIIHWGGLFSIILLICLALFLIVKTHIAHKKRSEKLVVVEELEMDTELKVLEKCIKEASGNFTSISNINKSMMVFFTKEKRKGLLKVKENLKEASGTINKSKSKAHKTIAKLKEASIDTGHYYIGLLDSFYQVYHSLHELWKQVYNHVDNNHNPLPKEQNEDLINISFVFSEIVENIARYVAKQNISEMENEVSRLRAYNDELKKLNKKVIKIIKGDSLGTRKSMLIMGIINEMKNISTFTAESCSSLCMLIKDKKP